MTQQNDFARAVKKIINLIHNGRVTSSKIVKFKNRGFEFITFCAIVYWSHRR